MQPLHLLTTAVVLLLSGVAVASPRNLHVRAPGQEYQSICFRCDAQGQKVYGPAGPDDAGCPRTPEDLECEVPGATTVRLRSRARRERRAKWGVQFVSSSSSRRVSRDEEGI